MKRTLLFAAVLSAGSLFSTNHAEAASFTYHGILQDAGKPAEGKYDIELTLYSAPSGGSIIGGPLTMYAVTVRDGSFSTEADFGPLAKSFSQVYVGVKVRSAGNGDFAALDARSSVTPDTNTSCPGSWSLDGNAGNPAGSYLGTADSSTLFLKAAGQQIVKTDLAGGGTVPRWIGGGSLNTSFAGDGAFIGGGGSNSDSTKMNQVGPWSVIGGGEGNASGKGATNGLAFVGGGLKNTANADYATICGGQSNNATGSGSTIGGGTSNAATGINATVPGGSVNGALGDYSFAAGAGAVAQYANSFVWSDGSALVGDSDVKQFIVQAKGGVGINTSNGPIGSESLSGYELTLRSSTGDGGNTDLALLSQASSSAAYRGFSMASEPNGFFSLAGLYNQSGTLNFDPLIYISHVHAVGGGSNSVIAFNRTGVNNGIFQIGSNTSNGNGAYLTAGGVWTSASSRTFKDDFARVSATDVLEKLMAIPVQTWFYKGDHDEGRHMGPVAEDFAQAFGLGNDEKHIGSVDESGVAFAAIQGLNQKVEAENAKLKSENVVLHDKLDDVLARLARLETAKGN